MERLSSFSLPFDSDSLVDAFAAGRLPPAQEAPFRVLLGRVTAAADGRAVKVYVCATEGDTRCRDYFAWALSRALVQHIPSTLLVDCDFLAVGMSGVVPHRDGLGFLDLLLYGSSLGVITQETSGAVRVVGAGSFPVTRRMPFVAEAFRDAARRLSNGARCVVYVGPLEADAGEFHPLCSEVDIVVRVSTGNGSGIVDPVDSRLAAATSAEVFAVRLTGAPAEASARDDAGAAAGVAAPSPGDAGTPNGAPVRASDAAEPTQADGVQAPAAPGPPVPAPVPPVLDGAPASAGASDTDRTFRPPAGGGEGGAPAGDAAGEGSAPPASVPPPEEIPVFDEPVDGGFSSTLPRLFTGVITVLVVAFIAWWIWRQNSAPTVVTDAIPTNPVVEKGTGNASRKPEAETRRSARHPVRRAGSGADTASSRGAVSGDAGGADRERVAETDSIAPVPAGGPADRRTGEGTAGGAAGAKASAAGATEGDVYGGRIVRLADVERDYAGQYVVHVSSFRDSAKARVEEVYLLRREVTAFIARVDLGAKGVWYRVYVGPWRKRSDARDAKKNLDELPRVKFTRIARIRG